MLQDIRERAQGWVAWFIVILISVPFALWGISSYLGGGSAPIVASVNGQEITDREFENRYRQFRQRLRDQLGDSYRPELIDETRMRREVLESMISNRLVLQEAHDMGLSAGDDLVRSYIASIPAFSVAGQFNMQAYERGIRSQGLSTAGFESQIRQSLISEQLSKAIGGSAIVTEAELKDLIRLRMQRRWLSYLIIPAKDFMVDAQVSDQEIGEYYDDRQQTFMAPERVKVEYLELDIGNISGTLEAGEESLLGFYEQHKSEYVRPEQRRASHILIALEEGASSEAEASALDTAKEAVRRIRSGEDFAAVAKEASQDPGSSEVGGDLGFIDRGVMDSAFEEAVFGMQAGEISDPIRTPFGYHVITVTEVRPESGRPFEEIKEEIRAAYLKQEAGRLFYQYAERLSDLAYEYPDSLQPAAEALAIPIRQSEWLERVGGSGIFASPKVMDAAFSAEVLLEGQNSEAIEVAQEHMVVLRAVAHEEAAIRPLDEVRGEIADLLKTQAAGRQAMARGEALLTRLKQGELIQALAAEAGLELLQKEGVGRGDRNIPGALQTALFRLPRPVEGGASYGQAVLPNGDFAVLALTRVQDGTDADRKEIGGDAAVKGMLQRSLGEAYFLHMVENLRKQADVAIPKQGG